MTFLKGIKVVCKGLDRLARDLTQALDVFAQFHRVLHIHSLIRSPGRQHLYFKTALTNALMMLQRVDRVIRGANHLHPIATHQSTCRELWALQLLVTFIVDLTGRIRVQQLSDAKGRAQFQVRPMIERITQGEWHRLCPLLELLPVGSCPCDEMFWYPIGTHGTPLVMVASQP